MLNPAKALLAALIFTSLSILGLQSFVAAADKTVVFIAGRDSHGFGSHEHGGGCRYLAATLEKGLPGIKTRVHAGGWPKDASIFDGELPQPYKYVSSNFP